MLEAVCTGCGETFVPASEEEEDLIHGVKENGDACERPGELTREYFYTGDRGPGDGHC